MHAPAASTTLDHILNSAQQATSPPAVLYIADFTYAGASPDLQLICMPAGMPELRLTRLSFMLCWDYAGDYLATSLLPGIGMAG